MTQRRKLKKSNKLWGKWYIDYNDKRIKKYKSQHKDKNKFLIKYQRRNNNIDQEMTEFIDYAWNENTDESKNTCRIKHLNPEVTVSTHAQNLESSSSSSGSTSNCIITVSTQHIQYYTQNICNICIFKYFLAKFINYLQCKVYKNTSILEYVRVSL